MSDLKILSDEELCSLEEAIWYEKKRRLDVCKDLSLKLPEYMHNDCTQCDNYSKCISIGGALCKDSCATVDGVTNCLLCLNHCD